VVNVRDPEFRSTHSGGARLNVLLTEDWPRPVEHWTQQLCRLLEPQGIRSYVARSGDEALQLSSRLDFDAAILDLGLPLGGSDRTSGRSGHRGRATAGSDLWLLELFRRLPNRPPVVLLRGPAYTQGQVDRLLRDALRMGVFSVLNKPINLEQVLIVFQRLIDRRYRGAWPRSPTPGGPTTS